mmetsp:Transcript_44354/g.128244  ORF Transcript_44354/g.128244 Transcript_44354/m.128244 type:complete len:301 (-) Transcript_44354:80-982(-)
MHTGSIPISVNDGLGVKRAVDLVVLAHTLKDVSRHHQLITGIKSNTRSNLVFLLTGHNFSIGSRDGDTGIKACLVHGISDFASETVFGSNRAVIGTLGPRGHTALGPSERSTFVQVEKSEFLLHAEPDFFVVLSFEGLFSNSTGIAGKRLASWSPGITHDQNVVNAVVTGTEGVTENSAWSKAHLRVVTWSLASRTSIEIPLGKLVNAGSLFGRKSSSLGTSVSISINPDIFSQNLVLGERQGGVLSDDGRVQGSPSGLLREDRVKGGRLTLGSDRGKGRGGDGAGQKGDSRGELHGPCN